MVLVKKVIDIIDIDMFVMFDDVMPIPISIIAVVFGGRLEWSKFGAGDWILRYLYRGA